MYCDNNRVLMCKISSMDFLDFPTQASSIAVRSPNRISRLSWSAALAFAALIGRSPAVQAANFNFTYAPGTSFEQMLNFEMAGKIWSDYLADDVTINIFVVGCNQDSGNNQVSP